MKRDDIMDKVNNIKLDIVNKVKSKFKLQQYDINEFESFSYPKYINLFKFNTKQYKIEKLGNMCILEGSSILGLSLLTVVFTPNRELDIPFVIIDFVEVRNKSTVFVEFYNEHMKNKDYIKILDTKLKDKNNYYKGLEDYIEKPNWYVPLRNKYSPLKKGGKEDKEILMNMILDYLDEYLNFVSSINNEECNLKNIDLEEFIEDLIVKGNPSSNILKKALGEDGYNRFCRDIIFKYQVKLYSEIERYYISLYNISFYCKIK